MSETGRSLLDDLAVRPAGAVAADLLKRPSPEQAVLTAADEADKLALTDLARAQTATESLVELSNLLSLPIPKARARRSRAQVLAYANRFDEALALLRESVALAESAGDRIEAARARMTTLHALARLGRLDEAIAAGTSAREAFDNAGEPLLAARANINLGVVNRMMDNPREAVRHFGLAKPVVRDQPMLLAQLQSNTAEALLDLHDFDAAEAAFSEALSAFEQAGVQRGAAIVEGNLADLAARRGRFGNAIEYFERARRRAGEGQAPGDLARLQAEHAEALVGAGMPAQAVEEYKAAVPVLELHQMKQEAARARAGLAAALMRTGHTPEAADSLDRAGALFEELGNDTGTARVLVARADEAIRVNDLAAADGLLKSALGLLSDRPADGAAVQLRCAELELRRSDLPTAETFIQSATATAQSLGLSPLLTQCLRLRSRLRTAQRRPNDALADLRLAADEVDRGRAELQADVFRAAFLADRVGVYHDLTSALLNQGGAASLAEAFSVCERGRCRTLLELIRGASRASPTDGDAQESALLSRLDHEIGNLNALYSRFDDAARGKAQTPDLESWRNSLVSQEARVADLEQRLAATNRFAGVFGEPAHAEDVRRELDRGTAFVEFFTEEDDLSAFVLRSDALHVRRRFSAVADMRELVESLYFQIGRALARGMPSGSAAERMSRDCTDELARIDAAILAPVADLLTGATRLVISPCAALHAVPFQAVVHVSGQVTQPVPAVYQVPSASVFVELRARSRAKSPTDGALIVGADDRFAPQVREESERIAAALKNCTLLLGENATVSRFLELAPGRTFVHIASHARFTPTDPGSSGIHLADGWVTARDFLKLNLQGAWVVLSGCDTGRAVIDSANEVLGLVRSVLVSGASGVILSLWPVHDQSTAEMMVSVASSLYSGQDSDAATTLSRAQGEAARANLHPAAWAPFIVVGAP